MISILNWNVCALPKYFNFFGDPKKRINHILDEILKYDCDIICLQEVFDINIRNYLITNLKNYNCIYSSNKSLIKINGGLFIATKHDILNYYEYNFKKTSGEDYLSNKGVLSCNIQIENIGGKPILIYELQKQNADLWRMEGP